ncbi:hypothetical protein CRG98_006357 [Punica granatum]|uniref:Uncharacterized protein n=1 Tax=Punica granatum TaxID=22663 RepID=A0A2I0KXM5_PUNGR|nr:hypothetical protein CRG98_006357 [Punica granatum]
MHARACMHGGNVQGARTSARALAVTASVGAAAVTSARTGRRARVMPSAWARELVTGVLFTREHDPNLKR